MSAAGTCLKCMKNILFYSRTWTPALTQVRTAIYSQLYQEPTLDEEALDRPLAEEDPRRYQPIKAAKSEESTSVNRNALIQKFTNIVIEKGHKDLARDMIDKTLENIKLIQLERYHKAESDEARDKIELNPKVIFTGAIENCKPLLILQDVKRGGVLYKVPIPVKPNYQQWRAIKWLIESAKDKAPEVRFHEKLAYEMMDAYNHEGKSIRKKQELHRVCEANRAYAHYRW